jgi:hypothetical protein
MILADATRILMTLLDKTSKMREHGNDIFHILLRWNEEAKYTPGDGLWEVVVLMNTYNGKKAIDEQYTFVALTGDCDEVSVLIDKITARYSNYLTQNQGD